MDSVEVRMACLKLAKKFHTHGSASKDDGAVVTTAAKWSDFVLGPVKRESAGLYKKGADEK